MLVPPFFVAGLGHERLYKKTQKNRSRAMDALSAYLELLKEIAPGVKRVVVMREAGKATGTGFFAAIQRRHGSVAVAYPSVDRLIEVLEDKVVRPAEAKFNELLARRTNQLRVENV
jgi:hypothetical protein